MSWIMHLLSYSTFITRRRNGGMSNVAVGSRVQIVTWDYKAFRTNYDIRRPRWSRRCMADCERRICEH